MLRRANSNVSGVTKYVSFKDASAKTSSKVAFKDFPSRDALR